MEESLLHSIGNNDFQSELVEAAELPSQIRDLSWMDSTSPLLIRAPMGAGGASLAQWIHAQSARKNAPFVAVSCNASHEARHFRGFVEADSEEKLGFFREANGGTLLLNHVYRLDRHVQQELLDLMHQGVVSPFGATTERVPVDVRLIAVTDRHLGQQANHGSFSHELHNRFVSDTGVVQLPSLQEYSEGVRLAVAELLAGFFSKGQVKTLSPAAQKTLHEYAWPGNIEELARIIQVICARCLEEGRRSVRARDMKELLKMV